MSNPDADDASRLLDQIDLLLREGIDFSAPSPESTFRYVQLLCSAAELINLEMVTRYGGRQGLSRGRHLIEQVVAAAFQTFGSEELHSNPFDKAAMLWRGITQGHPFQDGNKRTGFMLAVYFLERVGLPLPSEMPKSEVIAFGLSLSAGQIRDVNVIAAQLRAWWSRNDDA